jgi:hypothetical protein
MAPELFDIGDETEEPPRPTRSSDIYALSMVVVEVHLTRPHSDSDLISL